MSIACKCERCGIFYDPNKKVEAPVPNQANPHNTFNAITLNNKNYKNNDWNNVGFTRMDICPACAQSFTMWWGNPGITSNGDVKATLL